MNDEPLMRQLIANDHNNAGWGDPDVVRELEGYFKQKGNALSAEVQLRRARQIAKDMPISGSPGYLHLRNQLTLACVDHQLQMSALLNAPPMP